jgi:hypothetical protein
VNDPPVTPESAATSADRPAGRRPEQVFIDLPPYASSALHWLNGLLGVDRSRDALVAVLRRGLSIEARTSEESR